MSEFNILIEKAETVFKEKFPMETWFERAIFFSWSCKLERNCTFCHMSTLPKEKRTKEKVRSFASILAETLLCKVCGWRYGNLAGGIGIFDNEKMLDLLKKTNEIMDEKIWINIGLLNQEQIALFRPYIKGVIGSVETINPDLHKRVCPSKPMGAIEDMFAAALKEKVDCAMTIIIGLGETIKDFKLLESFIKKHDIKKIQIYSLNPHKGTVYENEKPPTAEYQAEWIAKTRIAFPIIDIECGIWKDRTERIELLLRAGANAITKYPVLKEFGSKSAHQFEAQARKAGRKFKGTVTQIPDFEWKKEISKLSFESRLKEDMYKKVIQYIEGFKKHS
jgi:biotin synthase-like enzyme